MKPLLLIALGGNALIQKGQTGTAEEQFANLKLPMRQIARLSRNHRIVITHGNGPQAGNLLLQQESCREVPNMPLEIIVAMTQGQIGYMIESTLDRALMEIGVTTEQLFVSLISYVVVDENDPAFQNPTKPIGPFYTEEQSKKLSYTMVKTDKGFRRVVASPKPLAIVEHREIKKLIELGFIVICCGGGGIPVIRKERKFRGVDASSTRTSPAPSWPAKSGPTSSSSLRMYRPCPSIGESRNSSSCARFCRPTWSNTWRKGIFRQAPWVRRWKPSFSFTGPLAAAGSSAISKTSNGPWRAKRGPKSCQPNGKA
jgi:hypothetical protein